MGVNALGDIFNIFEKIKDNWREWKSVPYAFLSLAAIYIWIALRADKIQNFEDLLLMALIFVGILLIYVFICAIHISCEKAKETTENMKKPKSILFFVAGICLSVILVIVSSYILITDIINKDGKYVIWADEYHIAMTNNVHNSYYLTGETVTIRGEKLQDYSRDCVFELDFNKDGTFTIAHGNKMYGVTPGHNGIGCSDACTGKLWKLEQADNDVYYIVNVDEGTYLKWYDALNNWTTHPNITENNKDQYLLCIEKVD